MPADLGGCSDPKNFVSDHGEEIEYEIDEFDGFKNRIKKITPDLKIFEKDSKDLFYFAILCATYYALLDKKENFEFCQDRDTLFEVFGKTFFEELKARKNSLHLDFQLFRHSVM